MGAEHLGYHVVAELVLLTVTQDVPSVPSLRQVPVMGLFWVWEGSPGRTVVEHGHGAVLCELELSETQLDNHG